MDIVYRIREAFTDGAPDLVKMMSHDPHNVRRHLLAEADYLEMLGAPNARVRRIRDIADDINRFYPRTSLQLLRDFIR